MSIILLMHTCSYITIPYSSLTVSFSYHFVSFFLVSCFKSWHAVIEPSGFTVVCNHIHRQKACTILMTCVFVMVKLVSHHILVSLGECGSRLHNLGTYSHAFVTLWLTECSTHGK